MSLATVFKAVLRRNFSMMRRYLFNTLSSLASLYMIFCLIFFGMKAFAAYGPSRAAAGSLEGTVVGFFVWMLALSAYSEPSWDLINEAQAGTLEQLYLAPSGFKWVCAFNLASNFLMNVFAGAALLLAMMATTGRWLNLDVVSVVPLIIVTLLGAYGIGFVLGGLALVFKRIQAFFQVVQFIFVGFLVIPWRLGWARLLPLTMGNALIYRVMVDGERLWELPNSDVLVALATGVAYLAAGIGVFSACERVAKDRGLLGHY